MLKFLKYEKFWSMTNPEVPEKPEVSKVEVHKYWSIKDAAT